MKAQWLEECLRTDVRVPANTAAASQSNPVSITRGQMGYCRHDPSTVERADPEPTQPSRVLVTGMIDPRVWPVAPLRIALDITVCTICVV